jgi:hypothetical protein
VGGDITNPQSPNRYSYALNDPTTLTDPSGLGPCDNLQYGQGKGLCQTDVNGVIAAATAFGPSSWDPFELMDISVVVNTGVYVPPFLGSPGEDVSTAGSLDEQIYGGSSELLGVNPMPGYFITSTVGNALTLFGGQFAQPLAGGVAPGGAGQNLNGFAKQVPWAGSVNVSIPPPATPGGIVFPVAYVPATNTECVGVGLWAGTPSERSAGGGPLLFGTLGNASNVLGGWSWSFNVQVTQGVGFQAIWNENGILAGPTLGMVPGIGLARTWSKCD